MGKSVRSETHFFLGWTNEDAVEILNFFLGETITETKIDYKYFCEDDDIELFNKLLKDKEIPLLCNILVEGTWNAYYSGALYVCFMDYECCYKQHGNDDIGTIINGMEEIKTTMEQFEKFHEKYPNISEPLFYNIGVAHYA